MALNASSPMFNYKFNLGESSLLEYINKSAYEEIKQEQETNEILAHLRMKYLPNSVRNNSFNKSLSKLSDNVTEIKDSSIINQCKDNINENFIEDISIHILDAKKKSNEKLNDINNNTFNRTKSIIKFPSENENIVSKDKLVTNSFIIDDNQYKNIKV